MDLHSLAYSRPIWISQTEGHRTFLKDEERLNVGKV